MKRFSLLCALAMMLSAVAMANIIPVNTAITPSGALFTWTYNFNLAADQNVVAGTGLDLVPLTRPDRQFVPHTELQWAGFVTVYDFSGFVAGSCVAPTGWTCTTQSLGYTPDNVVPTDNPNITNITWAYTSGAVISGVGGLINIGPFTAQSTSGIPILVSYTSRGVGNSGGTAGSITDNVGSVQGPAPTPEPATFGLLGAGLALLGAIRMKVNRA